MKTLLAICALCAAVLCSAQKVWQPSPGHVQIPVWPGAIPDARPAAAPESMQVTGPGSLVAGRPSTFIQNVSQPTLTVYPAQGRNTGASIIVFPGGGYQVLAIDLEGTEVCDWFVPRGITCIVLKYRVPAPRSAPDWGAYPQSPIALEDAQRSISIVRSRATEWHLDPHKIGVLGFSAGGHLVAAVSVHFRERIYKAVDAADGQSCRPDFAVALYPGHLSRGEGTLKLNPDIASRVSAQTPPTFLLQNEDDRVDTIWDAVSYYAALLRAHVPVEFHSYAQGGHAFGLRRTRNQATAWPEQVMVWLHSIGVVEN